MAAPSSYGVIIKLSRVETLFNQASVFGVHHDRSSFSSCNRGRHAGTGVALHQAGLFAGIDKALSPAGNGSIVVVQLAGGAGSTESLGQQGGGLLTGDGPVRSECSVIIAGYNTERRCQTDTLILAVGKGRCRSRGGIRLHINNAIVS